jgi:hypothetical protein
MQIGLLRLSLDECDASDISDEVDPSSLRDKACKNITIRAELLKNKPPRTFAHLLGIEGSIAGDYFRVWSGLSIMETTKAVSHTERLEQLQIQSRASSRHSPQK